MKQYMALLGGAMFFVACFSLYLMLESVSVGSKSGLDNGLSSIEVKIQQIENDLKKNHETISLIKNTIQKFAQFGDSKSLSELQKALKLTEKHHLQAIDQSLLPPHFPTTDYWNGTEWDKLQKTGTSDVCQFGEQLAQEPDVQLIDVYDKLVFDNPDGGVWKQGFPISYNVKQYENLPLKVFVVPHSHCDPGWIKTYERYYSDQVRHILNNMVDKLEQYPQMRFIYAEMSFFSLWWNDIDQNRKERVKRLLKDNRLEIVTGGWVMNDEANAHYFAMIDQMIEGNQWLLNEIGVKPESGWAIDPFGHSPTMAYLLHKMDISNMLIQRTHYSVKKYLAKEKKLEFFWRQNWDHEGTTDMFCHMMPFYSYDIPHTCGPDPSVCCQFDFKRLPGGKIACPWKVPPQAITDSNVEKRAEMLLDQYRKKAQLYKNNVVLIPLGDDFRYDKANEWDQQFSNYQQLFNYMNGRSDWNVQAQFGTLKDYFNALHQRAGGESKAKPSGFPVLSGDFYTYADRDDHYWSGYFTSRPFYKRMDRELESHVRGAEILYSQAIMYSRHFGITSFPSEIFMKYLVAARRNLGLYQHHDGVTGTAKDFVMVDYGNKMLEAMKMMKKLMTESAHFILMKEKSSYNYDASKPLLGEDEQRISYDSLPEKTVFILKETPKSVVFYNSLAYRRSLVVCIYVNEVNVVVEDSKGETIQSQVDPFWDTLEVISETKFKLKFVATVPALGLSTYKIRKDVGDSNPSNTVADVVVYNTLAEASPHNTAHFRVIENSGSAIYTENNEIKLHISTSTGTLQDITLREHGEVMKTNVEFMMYGVKNAKEKSGAYLFLPDGQAQPVYYTKPYIRVMKGPITSEVQSFLPAVEHRITIYNSPGIDGLSVDVQNLVDIRQHNNKELVMRISTDISNKDGTFYTDLNGFQIQKRKTYSKLPLQANYYPMPTMSYIEDDNFRFSILSGQSLGCASLQKGWLEVMQDRRLNQDDNRGLGQGVLDNKKTPNRFRLLLEKRHFGKQGLPVQPVGYPSITSHLVSQELIHPVVIMPQIGVMEEQLPLQALHSLLSHDMPCDLHVVNLKTMPYPEHDERLRFQPKDDLVIILHRLGIDCTLPARHLHCRSSASHQVSFSELFRDLTVSSVQHTSLSLMHDHDTINVKSKIQIPIMEIEAFKFIVH